MNSGHVKTQSIFNKTKKQKKGNKKTQLIKFIIKHPFFKIYCNTFALKFIILYQHLFRKEFSQKILSINQSINETCIDFVEMSKEEKIFIGIYMLKFFAIALAGKGKNTWINLCLGHELKCIFTDFRRGISSNQMVSQSINWKIDDHDGDGEDTNLKDISVGKNC